ncbi:Mitogen-activated protein kinase-binding protein 1 [Trichinella murrelli]|uniref:Mitogen-activated protein kinase-binding protein 1 n=1 Tax=Trichinella murrelli TaxID=144512 RepID=A0A0V0U5I1_9BILA|nr:Mitogen-activated protein kinase-binding protein 1 [Trichinella murrelli]
MNPIENSVIRYFKKVDVSKMATANMDIQTSPHRRMLRPRRQRTCSERKDLSEKRLIGQFYSYRCPWSRSPSKLHTHLIDEAGWEQYQLLLREQRNNVAGRNVTLSRVIGLTVNSNAALAYGSSNGVVAYSAGGTVVLYNVDKNEQAHIVGASKKGITCLAFSPDDRFLATGESGHDPPVRVWDLLENRLLAEFSGHRFGISCVCFSPNMKHLVSVGNQHDMVVNVWNWKSNTKVASNKIASKVMAISYSENGDYFVTAGVRHVKFWYLERVKMSLKDNAIPLQGRSAILADQRNNQFRDVHCGRGALAGNTYAITHQGLLCQFSSRRMLEKWVELKTSNANAMCLGDAEIFVACADGVVRIFNATTLRYIGTMPRPHYLGVDVAAGLTASHMTARNADSRFPDVIALAYNIRDKRLCCVYNDHSLYVWDVLDWKRVGKVASMLSHSGSIWSVDTCPIPDSKTAKVDVPAGTFVTCSTDDTIRLWNLDLPDCWPSAETVLVGCPYHCNIYSQQLMKIIYCDPDLSCLRDQEMGIAGSDKNEYQLDGKSGVRSVKVSPDCLHLASGDRGGNIRIYQMNNLVLFQELEAHEGDVLALEYSCPSKRGRYFLASASRDRLLHVLDVDQSYQLVCTIDDHSSSITALKMASVGDDFVLLSCGADKSIIYRRLVCSDNGDIHFQRACYVVGQTTFYDMDIDDTSDTVYTACQDRQIRMFSLAEGKTKGSIKGSLADDGTVIKIELDPSGTFVATCCSDKTICIFDTLNGGECVAAVHGHSELITGVKFTGDCRRLISVSGDSCIFVWNLHPSLTKKILARLAKRGRTVGSVKLYNEHVPIIANLHPERKNTVEQESEFEEEEEEEEEEVLEVGDNGHDVDEDDQTFQEFEESDSKFTTNNTMSNQSRSMESSTQIIYLQSPESVVPSKEDEFHVIARSDVLKQTDSAVGLNLQDSDDEQLSGYTELEQKNGSSIMPNKRRSEMVKAAYEQLSDRDDMLGNNDTQFLRRGSVRRQSLTNKYFNQTSSAERLSGWSSAGRFDSDRSPVPKATSSPKPMRKTPRATWNSASNIHLDKTASPAASMPLSSRERHSTLPVYPSALMYKPDNYEQSELHARCMNPESFPALNSLLNRPLPSPSYSVFSLPRRSLKSTTAASRSDRLNISYPGSVFLKSSASLSCLAQFATPDPLVTSTLQKLSEARERLRKSQENLALLWSRGRSSLNRTLSSNNLRRGDSNASLDPSSDLLNHHRNFARSVSCLTAMMEEVNEEFSPKKNPKMQDFQNSKRNVETPSPKNYSRSTTLPKFHRLGAGPAQKKVNQMRTANRRMIDQRPSVDSEDSSDTTSVVNTSASTMRMMRYSSPRRQSGSSLSKDASPRFWPPTRNSPAANTRKMSVSRSMNYLGRVLENTDSAILEDGQLKEAQKEQLIRIFMPKLEAAQKRLEQTLIQSSAAPVRLESVGGDIDKNDASTSAGETLTMVPAQIMGWDEKYCGWYPLEGGGLSELSIKQKLHYGYTERGSTEGDQCNGYRPLSVSGIRYEYWISGKRIEDKKVLLHLRLPGDVNSYQVMPTFQSWQIGSNRFGLKFLLSSDACKFRCRLQKAVEHVSRQSKSSSGESYFEDELEDDVFMPIELPLGREPPVSGAQRYPVVRSIPGFMSKSALCRSQSSINAGPSAKNACCAYPLKTSPSVSALQMTGMSEAGKSSSCTGRLFTTSFASNPFSFASAVNVKESNNAAESAAAKLKTNGKSSFRRRAFLKLFNSHSSSSQDFFPSRSMSKKKCKSGNCAKHCVSLGEQLISCGHYHRRSVCQSSNCYATVSTMQTCSADTSSSTLSQQNRCESSFGHVLKPLLPSSTASAHHQQHQHQQKQQQQQQQQRQRQQEKDTQGLLKDFVQREQCCYCKRFYLVDQNVPGVCPAAPDPFESLVQKVSCFWCFNCVLYVCGCKDPTSTDQRSSLSDWFHLPCSCNEINVDEDDNNSNDHPNDTNNHGNYPRHHCIRWMLFALLSLFVPCLWCYFPLKFCQHRCRRRFLLGARHRPVGRTVTSLPPI